MTINLPRVHCNVKEGDIIFGLPLDMFLAHRRIIAWEEIRKTHCIVNTALSALVELFRQRSAAVIEPLAPLHMLQPASRLASDGRIGVCRMSRAGATHITAAEVLMLSLRSSSLVSAMAMQAAQTQSFCCFADAENQTGHGL